MDNLFSIYQGLEGSLIKNILYVLTFLLSLLLIAIGFSINTYKILKKEQVKAFKGSDLINWIDKFTSMPFLINIKNYIAQNLSFIILDAYKLKVFSNVLVILIFLTNLCLILLLIKVGKLWYVKALVIILSMLLPYYCLDLFFDRIKQKINDQIPKLIDEFRSAFIEHQKIRPALKQCGLYVAPSLGKIISKVSDSAYLDKSLLELRNKFENVWFNIFASLLINYKENGGEIIDQLYKLNNTMTRYTNVEKKKNKRLIMYEIFAVTASVISIPVVLWVNKIILGIDTVMTDSESNIIIGKVIGSSIFSLVVVRVLRKL